MSIQKKGGGVGFLASETVKFREYSLPITELSTLEHFSIEIKTKRNPVLVVSLYRPPNQSIQTSIKDMKTILNVLKQDKRPVVICTDHNLDLLKASSHTKTQEFLELTSECGFLCTIGKPTRITHQTATLKDNIFISKEFSLGYKSWILIDDMSDHMPCFISLPQVEVDPKGIVQVIKRKIDKKSMNSIKMELLSIDWPMKLDKLSCEESFNYFHDILMECLDRHCPEKISQKKGKKSVQPWITKGLRKCLNKQRSLYKSFLKDRSNVQLIETYKRYKQCLQKTLRHAKNNYYSTLCMKHKGNTKKLWGIINSVIKRKADKTSLVDCLEIDNILVYDSHRIANEFGKYFASVGETLTKGTKPAKNSIEYYISKITESPVTMFLYPTDTLEIVKLIDSLKAKNSSGHDHISNCLLKGIKDGITTPLTLVINKSLKEGIFPSRMKIVDVVPLYKSKTKQVKTNYRPISLLPTLSKLLEKVRYNCTYQFMEKTSQFYDGQYGFRSKHSCENAIQNLLGDVIKGEDQGLVTTAVFLDLSKAFDTLSHPILFEKLYKYGIRGKTLDWFKSYLSKRQM